MKKEIIPMPRCPGCRLNMCIDCGRILSEEAEIGSFWIDLSVNPAQKWEKKEEGWKIIGDIHGSYEEGYTYVKR